MCQNLRLFRSWQQAGPGIDPNAPKKKPFFRFWELMRRNLAKLIGLNMIYTLLHTPLFFAFFVYIDTDNKFTNVMAIFLLLVQLLIEGPLLAGCSRVQRLIVLDKPFFFGEEFKKGFKANFGAAFLFWLIDAVLIASVVAGYYVYPQIALESGSSMIYIPYGITLAIALIVLFMNYYIMPLQAATTLSKKSVLKNAFMLVGLSLKECIITTLGMALMIGIMVALIFANTIFMFFLTFFPAAFIGYLVMFVHYPVIQKYVINPYYEANGEQNPEEMTDDDENRLFTDRSGSEEPVPVESPKKGKIIS